MSPLQGRLKRRAANLPGHASITIFSTCQAHAARCIRQSSTPPRAAGDITTRYSSAPTSRRGPQDDHARQDYPDSSSPPVPRPAALTERYHPLPARQAQPRTPQTRTEPTMRTQCNTVPTGHALAPQTDYPCYLPPIQPLRCPGTTTIPTSQRSPVLSGTRCAFARDWPGRPPHPPDNPIHHQPAPTSRPRPALTPADRPTPSASRHPQTTPSGTRRPAAPPRHPRLCAAGRCQPGFPSPGR